MPQPLHRFAPAQPSGRELRRHRQRLITSELLLHQGHCAARRFPRHGTSVPVKFFTLDQRFPRRHRLTHPFDGDSALHIQCQKPAALPGRNPLCPGRLDRRVTASVAFHRQPPVRKIQGDPPQLRALFQQRLLGGLQVSLRWCRARLQVLRKELCFQLFFQHRTWHIVLHRPDYAARQMKHQQKGKRPGQKAPARTPPRQKEPQPPLTVHPNLHPIPPRRAMQPSVIAGRKPGSEALRIRADSLHRDSLRHAPVQQAFHPAAAGRKLHRRKKPCHQRPSLFAC